MSVKTNAVAKINLPDMLSWPLDNFILHIIFIYTNVH